MRYDVVILGGGHLSKYLLSQSACFNLNMLVVSNQESNYLHNKVKYDDFFNLTHRVRFNKLIINSRFDRFNAYTTESILDFLSKHGNALFNQVFFTSSVAVYPDENSNMNESCSDPGTDYGASKLNIEIELKNYFTEHFVALRISNLYGGAYLSNLETAIRNAMRSEDELEIPQTDVTRDFVFAKDFARFVLSKTHLDIESGIYNFALGTSILLEDFINEYSRLQIKIRKTLDKPEIQFSNIDNSKFIEATNFEFTPLKDGIGLARSTIY